MNPSLFARLAPPLFVLIWATGFVVARLVAPHAEPLTFLLLRYSLAIVVLVALAVAVRAPWPRTRRGWHDGLVAGVLLHGCYLGGVFWAIKNGLPAGIAEYVGAALVTLPVALLTEDLQVDFVPVLWVGLLWAVFGLSIGGIG